MFHWDRGLKLTEADLAIDIARRQPRGFISHAHGDHMARHALAFCTPETAALYRHRLGPRDVFELPYGATRSFGGLDLKTYPAGHCLGSAMLWASNGRESLLYTGDFKLGTARTCRTAELPRADVLVMESTFGEPRFRHPAVDELESQLRMILDDAAERRLVPVFQAYALGKAQELSRWLSDLGKPVLQERSISKISDVYRQCGVEVGQVSEYPSYWRPGHAVVIPPRFHKPIGLARLPAALHVAVTGWAGEESVLRKWGADRTLGLSDHADFAQLLEAVERVQPREVYCFHGPMEFVDHLRSQGVAAYRLDQPSEWPAHRR
jgi:Cft2 family RNA processing exonuclease